MSLIPSYDVASNVCQALLPGGFAGHLDEVRVYSASLSAAELVTLPTCSGVACPYVGLIAHYTFADPPANTTAGGPLTVLPMSPNNGPSAVIGVDATWLLSEVGFSST